ncbi:MAG: SusC/RagA family TonB-linked outer membrane protein [Bacteroidales bacterium]|nr:SusC/RagA family TonB-linked outer membrane protein [Bacteroidales bacterium]
MRKIFLILFYLGVLLQVATAQNITMNLKDTSLKEVLKEIQNQTDYKFVYSDDLIKASTLVSVNVVSQPLTTVLDEVLVKNNIAYTINDKQIVLRYVLPTAPDTKTSVEEKTTGIIRGTVLDEEGNPLPGAMVVAKGNPKHNAYTDIEGKFELTDIEPNVVLLVTFLGYETMEYVVSGRSNLSIQLTSSIVKLGDVMVTGYQTLSRERTPGAFSFIPREQLDRPTLNIGASIMGLVPGVVATNVNEDGTPTNIQIRGLSTISSASNAQPLIVVDGFAVEGGFNSINPNDVENITILKDAAAASIWGARSGNGVIVITTKKAEKGLKVEFSSFVRVGAKLDLDYVNPLASSEETIAFEKLAFGKWGGNFNRNNTFRSYYGFAMSQGMLAINEALLANPTGDYMSDAEATLRMLAAQDNRQQIRDYLLANPVNQQYNLTLSSSTDRSYNTFSLMFADNRSNFKNTNDQQYMVNYRNTSSLFKWLDFHFSGMFQYNDRNTSGCSLSNITGLSPYDMLVNPDGSYLPVISNFYWPLMEANVPFDLFPYPDWTYNPIREMNDRSLGSKDLNARAQIGLTFKIIEGLTFDSKIQYELFNTSRRDLYGEETFYVRNRVNVNSSWNMGATVTPNVPKGSILDQSRTQINGYNFRNQLNFNRAFGLHEINMVAGTEISSRINQGFGYPTTYGYNDQTLAVGTFPNGPGGTFRQIQNWLGTNITPFGYTNSFSYNTTRYFALYANAAYTFNGKYSLSGSVRTDAANYITDDPKLRYNPFWSTGLGWQAHKEDFMQSFTWLDRLALRMTYGYNGNVVTSAATKPLITVSATPNTSTQERTASISDYGNPALRWERIAAFNFGVDYSLFNGKLFGKFDYYQKNGKDLYARVSIPGVYGTPRQSFNNAEMINRGIEMELGSSLNIIDNDIRWYGNFTFAYNYNKITNLYVENYAGLDLYLGQANSYVEGYNAATIWRYKYAGVSNFGTEAAPNMQPAVIDHEDNIYLLGFISGDARNYLWDIGTRVPPYTMGFTSQFKIYDFDLSFLLIGKFGHKFQRHGFNYPLLSGLNKALPNARLAEVMNGNPMEIMTFPQDDNDTNYFNWTGYAPYIDYLIDNANHIRMQEINLTYNVPSALLSKVNLSRLQLYAQINNLFVITANKYNEDPEFPMGTVRPQPKFTFGLKLNF